MTITGWRCDLCGKPIRKGRISMSIIPAGFAIRARSLDLHDTCFIDRILPLLPPDTDKEPTK